MGDGYNVIPLIFMVCVVLFYFLQNFLIDFHRIFAAELFKPFGFKLFLVIHAYRTAHITGILGLLYDLPSTGRKAAQRPTGAGRKP